MILHAIAALIGLLMLTVHPLLSVAYFAAVGFFFEKTQHRYVWSIDNGQLVRIETGWTGWITKHRIIEALGWPVGALIGSIALLIMKALGIEIDW